MATGLRATARSPAPNPLSARPPQQKYLCHGGASRPPPQQLQRRRRHEGTRCGMRGQVAWGGREEEADVVVGRGGVERKGEGGDVGMRAVEVDG